MLYFYTHIQYLFFFFFIFFLIISIIYLIYHVIFSIFFLFQGVNWVLGVYQNMSLSSTIDLCNEMMRDLSSLFRDHEFEFSLKMQQCQILLRKSFIIYCNFTQFKGLVYTVICRGYPVHKKNWFVSQMKQQIPLEIYTHKWEMLCSNLEHREFPS